MAEVLLPPLSIASDGCCVYIADNEQGVFAKVGTGRQGTIDGHVYKQTSGELTSRSHFRDWTSSDFGLNSPPSVA
jgi:hypothetical protein